MALILKIIGMIRLLRTAYVDELHDYANKSKISTLDSKASHMTTNTGWQMEKTSVFVF
jgi:hypothetical protein